MPDDTLDDLAFARRIVALVGVLVILMAVVLGLTWLERQILFPRGLLRPDATALGAPGLERWWHEDGEARVEAFWLPGAGVSAEQPGPAVVFTHGNGELIDFWPEPMAAYRERGVSVLLPEYRGYGRSTGQPSQRAIQADLGAFVERLRAHPAVDGERIYYHGRSLGGGAVGTILDRYPPRALVLQQTFTSFADAAADRGVPRFLITDRFDTRSALARYAGPALVIHGTRDRVIDVGHGRALGETGPRGAERRTVIGAFGHNDLVMDGPFWRDVFAFLEPHGMLP